MLKYYQTGGIDVTGDYQTIPGRYYSRFEREYGYSISIVHYKEWIYNIWIDLLHEDSRDINVLQGKTLRLKDAKQEVEKFFKRKHDFSNEIKEWKVKNRKPCFDKEFNLLGDWYCTYPHEINEVKEPTYILDRWNSGTYNLIYYRKWHPCEVAEQTINPNKEILDKMLSKIDYSRFFS